MPKMGDSRRKKIQARQRKRDNERNRVARIEKRARNAGKAKTAAG